jgi:hypothetical protein
MARESTTGISLQRGSPCKSLIAEVGREVDDDVCVVDAVDVGQVIDDLSEPKSR